MEQPMTRKERIITGVVVAVTAGGILAGSNLLIRNNESAARIEATVVLTNRELQNFINIRYQADMDRIEGEFARIDQRIDQALTK